MILSESIVIKITEYNYPYYENLGYDVTIGEELKIPIALLSKGSHHKILCKCDICGAEKEVLYKNYLKYKHNIFGEYFCRKCSEYKRKKTLQRNHGVDYPIQNEKIYNKMKKTLKKNKK